MKRRILIPVESSHDRCAECDSHFSDPTSIRFITAGTKDEPHKPLCLPCALSCEWCDQRLTTGFCVVLETSQGRQLVCKACADFTEASE